MPFPRIDMVRPTALLALVSAPLMVGLALLGGFDPVRHRGSRELMHREDGFVGSETCRSCHVEHHASWGKTFHRTMTQRPSATSVLGRFDGREIVAGEMKARAFRRDERFYMELPARGGGTRTAEVVLTVGSRRYQQYFEREARPLGSALVRLPLLWHVSDKRWLPVNSVFLGPDDASSETHRSEWGANCIFCHNTGPRPGRSSTTPPAFDSSVGELGISCESCHGPGALHAARHRNPITRYAAHLSGDPDPTIVDPARLDQDRATSVCGQCHGQRLPEPLEKIAAWLDTGPTFRAGDRLRDHVRPVARDTQVAPGLGTPDLFALRFWNDGTPRLTAYEYQGIVQSACYVQGSLTCNSCHTMHAGDPRGMLVPRMRTNAACTQCHEKIGNDVAAHTHHDPSGSGSSCVACHMPRMVYGILEIHRSHRIEIPHPARDTELGRPNACTLCHLDRSPLWAAKAMRETFGAAEPDPRERADRAPLDLPDALASLLAGDAVMRAVYASAMGQKDAALDPKDKGFLRVLLTLTLGDGYPSVRWLARRSLLDLERELPLGQWNSLEAFDHLSPIPARRRAIFELFKELSTRGTPHLPTPPAGLGVGPDFRPDIPFLSRLTALQSKQVINIGE